MSNIWNPHAFGVTGQPVGPQVNTLRVYGAEPSKEQLAMAQQTFAKFCMTDRLSFAPNQTQQGFLPDGSKYRIVVVGNTRIMEVRVEGDDPTEGIVRSGIVITLCNLNGTLIPKHSEEGFGIPYLFTPAVHKGTRTSTGKWTVRKLKPPDGGGKASNADVSGDTYFVGLDGVIDRNFPTSGGSAGSPNAQAYMVSAKQTAAYVYTKGKNVGTTYGGSIYGGMPLPFVLTDDDGKKYSAALLVDSYVGDPDIVSLFVGEIDQAPGYFVEAISTVGNSAIDWRGLSFSPDGRNARCVLKEDGKAWRCIFSISPTGLSMTKFGDVPLSGTTTDVFELPINDSGSITSGSTRTEWQYLNFNTLGPGGVSTNVFGDTGTGITTYTGTSDLIYAFGPRGQETDIANGVGGTERRSVHMERYDGIYESLGPTGVPEDGNATRYTRSETHDYSLIDTATPWSSEFYSFVDKTSRSDVRYEKVESYSADSVVIWYSGSTPTKNVSASGGGSGHSLSRISGGYSPIFFDRYMKFAVYLDESSVVRVDTWTYVVKPGGGVEKVNDASVPDTPASKKLVVQDKNGVIFSLVVDMDSWFVAYSASDPKTGALLVNLQQVDGTVEKTKLKSWLYLVDDTGAKHLSSVIGTLPADTRAISNASIYSL